MGVVTVAAVRKAAARLHGIIRAWPGVQVGSASAASSRMLIAVLVCAQTLQSASLEQSLRVMPGRP